MVKGRKRAARGVAYRTHAHVAENLLLLELESPADHTLHVRGTVTGPCIAQECTTGNAGCA
jgi:hypothetical protein